MIVVLFSGGIGSWAAARRLKDRGEELTLLFTDTNMEDEDLYRFLDDAAADLETPITRIADGRDVWEVFRDEKFIGNTRVDICSRILKRDLARKWIDDAYPDGVTVAMGIDWSEAHRFERARPRWEPHTLIAPLCDPPYLSKRDMLEAAAARGIRQSRLYELGFQHNNCGGFCVKAGQAQFAHLLSTLPERYAYHEAKEQEMRDVLGKDVAVLKDRRGGESKPMTLKSFRLRIESETQDEQLFDPNDWGGCGCMVDDFGGES